MSAKLPIFIDPVHLARLGVTCEGTIPVAGMSRLMLDGRSGEESMAVSLAFELQGKIPVIRGRIDGGVWLACQRCLEPMRVDVHHDFLLAVVASEDEAVKLEEDVAPLLLSEKKIAVSQLVEDELLILLPDVPAHSVGVCELAIGTDVEPAQSSEKRPNPFQLLQGLKN